MGHYECIRTFALYIILTILIISDKVLKYKDKFTPYIYLLCKKYRL